MAEETPRLYLTDVHLKGYKSIKDTQATLNEGINIIIGPNGSGKTNFLEFLEDSLWNKIAKNAATGEVFIQYIITNNKEKYNFIWNVLYRTEENVNLNLAANQKVNDKALFVYKALFEVDKHVAFSTVNEDFEKTSHFIEDFENRLDFFLGAVYEVIPKPVRELCADFETSGSVKYLTYILPTEFSNLAKPIHLKSRKNESPFFGLIETQIGNILLWIWHTNLVVNRAPSSLNAKEYSEYLRENFLDEFNSKYLKDISEFTPIKGVRISQNLHFVERADFVEVSFLLFEFKVDNDWYLWEQLSDGTRRAFYIVLTISYMEVGPILLEEPELGLYPDQLQKLLTFIKEQSSRLQFIITTHSPDVLDILGIDELDKINICEMKGEEGTKIRKMTEAQKRSAAIFFKNTGFLSDYWKHKNLGIK